MNDIVKTIADNGLGFGSFIALLYFVFRYQEKQNAIMGKISDTMIQMQLTMETMKQSIIEMTDRIENIENKIKGKEVQ